MTSESKNNSSDDLIKWKIFPRNLTAHADFIVSGNPSSSRPESSVGNNWPGLEYDDRNLEKAFFPGFYFEYHREEGAILKSITPNSKPNQKGLKDSDLPLYLWAMICKRTQDQIQPEFISFNSLDGQGVWRIVRDLLPGEVTIFLGHEPGIDWEKSLTDIRQTFINKIRSSGESGIFRNDQGVIEVSAFVDERTRYLDDDGVINIDVYSPGELTRTMCSPWQYDFRDCGCFFWAATKPDIVTSEDGKHPYLNYQRKDRSNPPPTDIPIYGKERRNLELNHEDLIADDWWNKLPVVINDRESEQIITPTSTSIQKLMTRDEVIEELHYLATVEHALCVEYLYAHYSLNCPPFLPITREDYSLNLPFNLTPSDSKNQSERVFAAAKEVFMIAVDEMRHLRWVNEALNLLNTPPSLGRAEVIGRSTFKQPFSLKRLTPDQLDWFINVEKPSRAINEGVDGMYVQLHASIDKQPDQFPEHDRLVHLIKLIIDEGGNHYERFLAIKGHLSGLDPSSYLRFLSDPLEGTSLVKLQDLCDAHYEILLGILGQSFSLGHKAGGILLEQARRQMFNLHETANLLASKGLDVNFKLPVVPLPSSFTSTNAHNHVDALASKFSSAVLPLKETGGDKEKQMIVQHEQSTGHLFDLMHKLIRDDIEGREKNL